MLWWSQVNIVFQILGHFTPVFRLRNTFSTTAPLIIQNIFDVTILALILSRGLQGYRLKGGLIETLMKDGLLYFL